MENLTLTRTVRVVEPVRDKRLSIVTIIPLYNGARWIERAINSVLGQTLPPDEFIVVDDGSTDEGPEIVERLCGQYPITLLRKENGGQSAARNFGVAHSTGDLIALLDQDDIWYPTHLEEMIKPFLEDKSGRLGWVYTDFDEVDANGQMVTKRLIGNLAEHPKRSLLRCLSENMLITPGASLIRRTAFEAVEGFDIRLSGYEDDDLFLRLFRAGYDNIFIDTALSQWRIFEGSSGHSNRMYASAMIYMDKLMQEFPDDLFRGHYYGRDLIAPRFVQTMMMIYGRSMRNKNAAQCREAVKYLKRIVPHLRLRHRVPLAMALPFMASPTTGRVFLAGSRTLVRFYRGIVRRR
ncbi:MAG TPA: glycosyltransferase family A protein [Stellaceae bacterium]|nr:glycosyltransferase family A protein [Stellaceae bacterium]